MQLLLILRVPQEHAQEGRGLKDTVQDTCRIQCRIHAGYVQDTVQDTCRIHAGYRAGYMQDTVQVICRIRAGYVQDTCRIQCRDTAENGLVIFSKIFYQPEQY